MFSTSSSHAEDDEMTIRCFRVDIDHDRAPVTVETESIVKLDNEFFDSPGDVLFNKSYYQNVTCAAIL